MTNPFHVVGPAVIRFSGGRTSAFMLRQILDAHDGVLPEDVHIVFSNTGKERPETLDFVQECARARRVRIRWVEWRLIRLLLASKPTNNPPRWLQAIDQRKKFGPGVLPTFLPVFASKWTEDFAEVTYDTASRHGEPFARLIQWKQYLPNPVSRICTEHLKIEAMKLFALFELGFTEWDSIIGIRYDEPRRWRIIGQDKRNPRETVAAPLVDAHVTEDDVMAFWRAQPFDLRLMSHEGNCDLCFLKGRGRIERLIRSDEALAAWWIEQERTAFGRTPSGSRFRIDRPSYARMLDGVQRLPLLPGLGLEEDNTLPCACTD